MEQSVSKNVEELASYGLLSAQKIMAQKYLEKEDFTNGLVWLRRVAEQGDAWAQYSIGKCFYDGTGEKKSFEQAIIWFKKASDQGNAQAQFALGKCFLNGDGVDKNYHKALELFNKAEINFDSNQLCRLMEYKALIYKNTFDYDNYHKIIVLFSEDGLGCNKCTFVKNYH